MMRFWEGNDGSNSSINNTTTQSFVYADSDSLADEINEFYSYGEIPDTLGDSDGFEKAFSEKEWVPASLEMKTQFIKGLLDGLSDEVYGYGKARVLLYIAQGVYNEVTSPSHHIEQIENNCGIIQSCDNALNTLFKNLTVSSRNACSSAEKIKPGNELSPSHWNEVIVYINIIYFVVIIQGNKEEFRQKLGDLKINNLPLVALLFKILADFNEQPQCEGYPLKKLLLLLWKCVLTAWGGVEQLKKLMNCARYYVGLPPVREGLYTKNTLSDLEDYELNVAGLYYGYFPPPENGEVKLDESSTKLNNPLVDVTIDPVMEKTLPIPIREGLEALRKNVYISLSEVQFKDFLEEKEGRVPRHDLTNVITPLSKEELASLKEQIGNIESTWKLMFPNLSKYVIILLKILLAAIPSQKKFTGTVNLMSELQNGFNARKESKKTYVETLQLAMDENRHKEIIAKTVSAIIFLLLKHTKICHILMHEYLSQLLVEANCVLLILKYLNQDISAHLVLRNTIEELNFLTYCSNPIPEAIGARKEGNPDQQEAILCWRNAFTTANLLRILQKLTKGKSSRISVLTQYKTAGILKRLLKIPHEPLVYYASKIIKSQLPYLGRKWRSSNMRTISPIVLNVRSHYRDTQLFVGYDDIVEEIDVMDEQLVAETIEQFNRSRYIDTASDGKFDEAVASTSLGHLDLDLDIEFEENYESWYDTQIGPGDEDYVWDSIDHLDPLYGDELSNF